MSVPEPRKPSMLPAAFALLLIVALGVFVWMSRGAEHRDAPATAASAPAAAAGSTSQPAPTPPVAHAPTAAASGGAAQPTGPPGPEDEPRLSSQQPPEPKAKKPKLTLDERLQLTQQHIGVMQTRAEAVQREIDALEAAGKKDDAAKMRVVLTRLKAHMDRLRAAIAEHREPE